MNLTLTLRFSALLTVLLMTTALQSFAQAAIKIGQIKANHVDKQKRKQGDWIFFDSTGSMAITCVYSNDVAVGPIIFYENTDTAFVRYPVVKGVEAFDIHLKGKLYRGSFLHEKDSIVGIDLEAADAPTEEVVQVARKYQTLYLSPQYHFKQKPLADYWSASLYASRFVFNKKIVAVVSVSAAGFITKVSFPVEKNSLSADEETELHRIYSGMPRWQPLFYGNKTLPVTMTMAGGSTDMSIINYHRY